MSSVEPEFPEAAALAAEYGRAGRAEADVASGSRASGGGDRHRISSGVV